MAAVTSSFDGAGLDAVESGITALCVDDDPHCLTLVRSLLERDDRFEVLTEESPDDALERLDGADCVVSDYEMPGMDGQEFFDAVRDRRPGLPFVLLTGHASPEIAEPIVDSSRTEYLQKETVTDALGVLPRRVSRLVDDRRIADLAKRTLGAVEAAREGIAVVDPAGEFVYTNRPFARRFGHAREDLTGRSWDAVFTPAERTRLEATALQVVEEGWRWTGSCEGRRSGGETVTVRTTIAGLDDGSTVFAVTAAA